MIPNLFLSAILPVSVLACADHTGLQRGHLSKRATDTSPEWTYDASYNWGALHPDYAVCQTGTQQSPIALSLTQGLSQYHRPVFRNYDRKISGNWTNWGYGPSFTLDHPPNDYTGLPSMKWDNVTAYLKGWHIHAPADHSVAGDRSKAEMHLVHVDRTGHEVAVAAIRLDPGIASSPFFAQLPTFVPFVTSPGLSPAEDIQQQQLDNKPRVVQGVRMNMKLALDGVYYFNEFWTYKGSLTSPPCMEGLRWFVARATAFTSVKQMRTILGACTYSAREEQEVWLHEINSA
ncbi:MAG: hypothetical protein Q9166_000680 [cf. Caloplaca sp. 2 TL-2023]